MANMLGVEVGGDLEVGVAADVAELELCRVDGLEWCATAVANAGGAGGEISERSFHAVESLELGCEQSVQVSVVDGGRASGWAGELDDLRHEATSGNCPNYRRKGSGALGGTGLFLTAQEPWRGNAAERGGAVAFKSQRRR